MDLFTPLTIRGTTLRNRIVVSPMMQYSTPKGVAGPWHLVHLGSRAVGGAALVIAEQTAVAEDGRSTLYDLGLWNDEQGDALRAVASFVEDQGSIAGIQLGHAGRKGGIRRPWDIRTPLTREEGAWSTGAPSAIAQDENAAAPRAMTIPEIEKVVRDFSAAARRAVEAGFRYIELHAGHGYLLHQFLSPVSNRRDDEFGGDADRRWRILYDAVAAVRIAIGTDRILAVRLSALDRVAGGQSLEDSIVGARRLADLGVDVVVPSSLGGIGPGAPTGGDRAYPELAEAFRRRTGLVTATVGRVTEPEQADAIIRSGQADLVVLARAMLRDPYWPSAAAKVLGREVPHPDQYARAWI